MKPDRGFVQIIVAVIFALAIGAVAMFGYQKYIQKPTPSPTQSPLNNNQTQTTNQTSPSPVTTNETTNWKTYEDLQENFTLKYPADKTSPEVHIAGRDSIMGLFIPDRFLVTLSFLSNGNTIGEFSVARTTRDDIGTAKNAEEFIKQYKPLVGLGNIEEVSVSGKKAYKLNSPKDLYIIAIDDNDHQIFIIGAASVVSDKNIIKQLDQILTTFKFTN